MLKFCKKINKLTNREYIRKHLSVFQKRINQNKIPNILKKSRPVNHCVQYSIDKLNSNESNIKIENEEFHDFLNKFENSDPITQKLLFYGSENVEITSTNYNCTCCKSNLQCSSKSLPGYIPYEVYLENLQYPDVMESMMCIRCYFLQNELDPLDVPLDNDYYTEVVARQLSSYKSATILLLADLVDLPHSIYLPNNLLDLMKNHEKTLRVFLIGNKSDLFDCNDNIVYKYLREQLMDAAEYRGIPREFIEMTEVISGLKCDRVDNLIDKLISKEYFHDEPMFLVGSTNVGKSTLFNQLIKSDLCKKVAQNQIRDSFISYVPGTTINVLKFPMISHIKGLISQRMTARNILSSKTNLDSETLMDSKKLVLGDVKSERYEFTEKIATYRLNKHEKISDSKMDEKEFKRLYETYDENAIQSNRWCFDTPGYINPDQIINYLESGHLKTLNFRHLRVPRIYKLAENMSILLANLVRVDIVQSSVPIFVAVHTTIPPHIVDTDSIEEYQNTTIIKQFQYKSNLSQSLIDRIKQFDDHFDPHSDVVPRLLPTQCKINLRGHKVPAGDIGFSSIGWMSVCGEAGTCVIDTWLPAGLQSFYRANSLLPEVVSRISTRIGRTREYKLKPPITYTPRKLAQFYKN